MLNFHKFPGRNDFSFCCALEFFLRFPPTAIALFAQTKFASNDTAGALPGNQNSTVLVEVAAVS